MASPLGAINLFIWFGINALFALTTPLHLLGATLPAPDLATAGWFGLLLAGLSFLAMKYGKFEVITELATRKRPLLSSYFILITTETQPVKSGGSETGCNPGRLAYPAKSTGKGTYKGDV